MTPRERRLFERAREVLAQAPRRNRALLADLDAVLGAGKLTMGRRILAVLASPMTAAEVRAVVGSSQAHVWNELIYLEGAGLVERVGFVALKGRRGPPAVRWAREPPGIEGPR